ncbi:MAG: hypothetical protein GXZ11_05400 [Tissierellia bacterium]|nr:hypothetical protein [Tissierellia bacterium]
MKKSRIFIIAILAFSMILLAACGGAGNEPEKAESEFVGKYKLVKIVFGEISLDVLEDSEMAMELELSADGKASMKAISDPETKPEEGIWKEDSGAVLMTFDTYEGDLKLAKSEDGKFSVEMTEEGETMVLIFEKATE